MERNQKKTALLREVAMGMPANRRFLINQVCDRLDCAEDTIEKLTQDNAGLQKELHETKSELQSVIKKLHETESEKCAAVNGQETLQKELARVKGIRP